MATLKKYDGTVIPNQAHKHTVEDTVNSAGTGTALATSSESGFLSSTDKTELNNLKTLITNIAEKMVHKV